jgi:hypothetical protein
MPNDIEPIIADLVETSIFAICGIEKCKNMISNPRRTLDDFEFANTNMKNFRNELDDVRFIFEKVINGDTGEEDAN